MIDLNHTTLVGFSNGQSFEGYTTLESPSPYSLYDMAGNVWQRTENVYENQHFRYMRGGSKVDDATTCACGPATVLVRIISVRQLDSTVREILKYNNPQAE